MADDLDAPELKWIEACDTEVAKEARDILSDVLGEMDLMHDPQVISPYPHDTDDLKWRGYHDQQAAIRTGVVEMLMKRRILRSAQSFHERGEGLRVTADEVVVRRAHGLLEDRVRGRSIAPVPVPPRSSLPKNMQNALPPEPAPAPRPERVPREFKEGFFKGAGEHAGKWVMGVVILLALAVLTWVFKLWKPVLGLLTGSK